MKKTFILVVALATASSALAQAAPGHSGHGEAVAPAHHAQHQQAAPEGAAQPTPDAPAAHAMDCCKEDAAEPCQMPCCARMRQQQGAAAPAASPAEHGGH